MGAIPANVIIFWPSTNGTIPTGFSRETSLDAKYPKGANTSGAITTTGGATTHSHTSPSHYHTLAAHTHTYQLDGVTGDGAHSKVSGVNLWAIKDSHYHTGTSGAVTDGDTTATSVTYGSVSNDPPYVKMIHMKSNGTKPIPTNAVIYSSSTTIPTGYQNSDGTNSTTDLRNKYLKGADTSGNSGATGGSTTNSHDITHTHTAQNHSHAAVPSTAALGHTDYDSTGSSNPLVTKFHTHSITWNSSIQDINACTDTLVTAETVEPPYHKLLALWNKTSASLYPGMIGIWLGSVATIPTGWLWCNGDNGTPDLRGRYIKCANDTSEVGNVGGSATHSHAAQSHSHTGASNHSHTAAGGMGHTNDGVEPTSTGTQVFGAASGRSHNPSSYESKTVNYNSATTTGDSANNEPPYVEVAYIMFSYESLGGGAVLAAMQNL